MIQRVRCIILGPTGRILLGRNRSHRFNLPGGKLKEGEHPVDGLYREIEEETGYTKLKGLKYLWEHKNNKIFVATQEEGAKPTNANDPDQEFNSFGWFNIIGLPVRLDRYAKAILQNYKNGLVKNEATSGKVEVLIDGKKVYDFDDDMVWETMPRVVQKKVNEGKDIEFRQILDDGSVVDFTPKVFPDYMKKAESDKLPGGLADNKTPKDFNKSKLRDGTLIELEHTKDQKLAEEIAMDHLTEDPEYYVKLRKIEGASGGNTERAIQMKKIYDMINELLSTYIPEEKTRPSAEIVYEVDYMGKTTWRPMAGDQDYTHITVNHKIVNNDDMLRQVLAHEIIHHHLYQTYGKDVAKHGEHFEMIASEMNVKEGKNFVTEFANHTDFKKDNAEASTDKVLWQNEWIAVKEKDGWYTYTSQIKSDAGIAVLVYDPIKKMVLGRWEHNPVHGEGLSLTSITGMMDKEGMDKHDIAIMELDEEAGLQADRNELQFLTTVHTSKSSDYKLHLFAIDGSKKELGEAKGDGTKGEEGAYVSWISVEKALEAGAPSIGHSIALLASKGVVLI